MAETTKDRVSRACQETSMKLWILHEPMNTVERAWTGKGGGSYDGSGDVRD